MCCIDRICQMQTLVFLLFESFPSPLSEISNYPLLLLAAPQPVLPFCAESSAGSLSIVVALLRASRASLVDRTEIAAFKPFKPKRTHIVQSDEPIRVLFFSVLPMLEFKRNTATGMRLRSAWRNSLFSCHLHDKKFRKYFVLWQTKDHLG